MATCDLCGNDYDKTFTVTTTDGRTGTFDSFECAIHALAPECPQCGCKVIGHGVEEDGSIFCCAHCARRAGISDLKDRGSDEAQQGARSDDSASEDSFPASDSPAW